MKYDVGALITHDDVVIWQVTGYVPVSFYYPFSGYNLTVVASTDLNVPVGVISNGIAAGDVDGYYHLYVVGPPVPPPPVVVGPPVPPPPVYTGVLPEWLHIFLMAFNVTILTWDINAGDAIETALSWAVGLIDSARGLAQQGLDLASAAWDHALDVVTAALAGPLADIAALWAWKDTLWSGIETWWTAKQTDVLAWISTAVDNAITGLQGFLSLDVFLLWWGHIGTSFTDWWDAARAGVLEAVDVTIKPVRDQTNVLTATMGLVTDTSDAALRWLWDRITTAIVRLW